MRADVGRALLFVPGVLRRHHRLQRLRVRADVVVGLHEVLREHLPVERTVPFHLDHHLHLVETPRPEDFAQARESIIQLRRGAIEIDEDKAIPHLAAELLQTPRIALELLRLLHLGRAF